MKVSVRKISEITGFSPATVSNALNYKKGVNAETSAKIFKVAQDLGYFEENHIRKIKFVMFKRDGAVVEDSPFFIQLISGVEQECRACGMEMQMCNLDKRDPGYQEQAKWIMNDKASAVILLGTEMVDADKAKIYYLYLEKSGSTYSVKNSVAVDSSNGAGRWTDIELTNPEGTTLAEIKPVVSYIDTSYLGTQSGIKVAWLESVSDGNLSFEAMTDPANYSSSDQRTSVMAHVKETKDGSVYSPVAVGFNSDMFAVDFLRGEE